MTYIASEDPAVIAWNRLGRKAGKFCNICKKVHQNHAACERRKDGKDKKDK